MDIDELPIDEEGTETEDDLGAQDLKIYSKAVLWGTDWTAETIVSQLKKQNIQLNPAFQRRDAWDKEKKSKFIESLMLGLPVPPIILAEDSNKKNSYIVIDGKQRLLSILQFCTTDEEKDFIELRLTGLEILKGLNGYSYQNITESGQNVDYKTQFDNQTIRTVVIRNWNNEKLLYTVFHRLNTGSLKLSPQELRQALHPGDFVIYANDYSTKSVGIKKLLNLKKPDPRMRDVEIIIRYFAFKNYENEYKGNLKDFLDETCRKLNDDWMQNNAKYEQQALEMENAITFTESIFGEKASFSKYLNGNYTGIFNRTIFDIMVVLFSESSVRESLSDKKTSIKKAFEEIMTSNRRFIEAVSGSTKDLDKTRNRYAIWREKIELALKG